MDKVTSSESDAQKLPNFSQIEKKWQGVWEKQQTFKVETNSKKKKTYVLEMFPYPSGAGLHMGHALNYTIGDIFARFQRMNGYNVLYPMGYDAFGLPAENAAIKASEHPSDYTKKSMANFVTQQKALGLSYDWSKKLQTCTPDYYKWNQYFFIKLFEKGLIYRKKSAVNWCSKCNTVLANEQVHNGTCWRHEDTAVEMKQLEQWFIKTTDYADELLEKVDALEWPERIKSMQKNWIGKSHGTEINFEIDSSDFKKNEFVFLHAYKDNSKSVFWPWLTEEIKKRGGKIAFAPDLPNTTKPNIEEQAKYVLDNYNFNENTVLVTHSLSGVLAMKLLPKIKSKIKKLIMIAPPLKCEFKDNKSRPILEECCDWKFDFAKIKEKVKEIIVVADKNDHVVPDSHPVEIAQKLGASFILAKGSNTHFNSEQESNVLSQLINTWPVFTTRPDTIFGVTFLVVSAQHPKLFDLVTAEQKVAVQEFLKKLKSVSEKELEQMDKEGVFTGAYAINPLNGDKVPIWVGNFVVADYGSGMVMAVPTHDQRDFEFAKKYKIPMKTVIIPHRIDKINIPIAGKPYVERKSIVAIIKNPKTNKYLTLKWKKQPWVTFVTGGIEDGEDIVESAKREILEETGYKNVKLERVLGETQTEFFAAHKGENRRAFFTGMLFSLIDEERTDVSEKEKEIHEVVWKNLSEINENNFTCAELDVWLSRLNSKDSAYTAEGVLVNSGRFNGLNSNVAIEKISEHIVKNGFGNKTINFKLRDWLVSRQRYWGTPIPMVYCDTCGVVPVKEKDLPIELPYKVTFGEGNPLKTNKEFVNTSCPKCNSPAKRETDTMDTFFDSSWYYLRYPDNTNSKLPFEKKNASYWLPVDQYIGGAEHACMHLIYARFFTKALRDMGYLDFDEPFTKLFNQGMLHGSDGNKMSKSLGNVVNPLDVIGKFSADALRFNLMSLSAPNSDSVWSDRGMESAHKFIAKVYLTILDKKIGKSSKLLQSKLNRTIRDVTKDISTFRYNIAIIKIRALFDSISNEETVSKEDLSSFLSLLHPIAPHVTEELFEKLGNKTILSSSVWPTCDVKKIDDNLERIESIVTNLRLDVLKIKELAKLEKVSKVRIFVSPEWKWDVIEIVKKACENKPDFGAAMKAVSADASLKKYSGEIPNVVKSSITRLAEIVTLEKFDEVASLIEAKPALEKEFGIIEIIKAEDSKEIKAKNAFPAKPALLVE